MNELPAQPHHGGTLRGAHDLDALDRARSDARFAGITVIRPRGKRLAAIVVHVEHTLLAHSNAGLIGKALIQIDHRVAGCGHIGLCSPCESAASIVSPMPLPTVEHFLFQLDGLTEWNV
jgi:hypothetical protein